MLNKKYIVKNDERLKDLGFRKTKSGYRKNIGNLKLKVENGLMTVKQDNNKVFYINSFEKLDLLIKRMINGGIISNVLC